MNSLPFYWLITGLLHIELKFWVSGLYKAFNYRSVFFGYSGVSEQSLGQNAGWDKCRWTETPKTLPRKMGGGFIADISQSNQKLSS